MRQWITGLDVANTERKESGEKVVFCRGFIYETHFVNWSDESDRYNIGVFHQPSRKRKYLLVISELALDYFLSLFPLVSVLFICCICFL